MTPPCQPSDDWVVYMLRARSPGRMHTPDTTLTVQHNPHAARGHGKLWKKCKPFRDLTNPGGMKERKPLAPSLQSRGQRHVPLRWPDEPAGVFGGAPPST